LMYAYGVGIEKDEVKAIEWLHKAANQGDIVAMNDLAVFYDDGIGGKKDHVSVC
jgi:TPR repeat protein